MYKIGIDDNYKNNIYTNDAIHSLVIKINNNIIDSKYVRKLQKQHDILAGEKLSIGSACSQCITLQLDYDALNNIQEINEVYIEENVIIGDSTYKIPLGYFYLSNNGIDSTNKAYATLKLYDKLYTLNIPYSTSSEFIENNNKTRLQIVQDICAKNGMYLETTNFLGYDKIDNVYNDDMTYQNWLVFISERAGGFCRVGREKNSSGLIPLSIISLTDLETNIIPNNMLGNFVEGNTFTISKVATSIITNYGDDTGTTIFLSADNILPLTNNDIEEIYNKIKNVTFQNFEVKTWGDSTIDAGDFIQIGDYKTIAEIDMDYANGYYGTYKFNKQLPESDTEIVKIQSSGNKRYTKKRIEELENGYKFVVQSVETLEKEVTTIKETSGNNSLYIEDALESRVLEYGIDGKSEQETRSGKNLLNLINNTGSSNGVSYEVTNSNQISFSGTATTTYCDISPRFTTKTLPKGTYTFSVDKPINAQIVFYAYYNDTQYTYLRIEKNTTSITIDIPNDTIKYFVGLTGLTSGNTYSGAIKLQLEKGSNATEIEQYGASPSPDYPSEIKNVEGIRNLFDSLKGTSTTKNGMTITCTENSIILNGTTTAIANFWFDNLNIPLKKGAISFLTNVNLDGKGAYVWKENSTNILQTNNSANITIESDKTITQFLIQINSGVTFNNQEFKILLAEGNVSTFVPYGSWLKVQTTGKNLFDKNKLSVGYLNADGTINSGDGTYRVSDFISVKPNTIYYKGITQTSRAKFYNKNKQPLNTTTYQDIPNGASATQFTTPNDAYYLRVSIRSQATDTYIDNLQIEQNDKATTYEPYKENISLIDMNKPNLFDGELILGNLDNVGAINQAVTYRLASKNYISVEPNKVYSIINDKYELGVVVVNYDENKNFISRKGYGNGGKTQIIVTESNAKYIRFCSGGLVDNPTNDTTTKYEIYEGVNNYYELCSIGDIKDNLIVNQDGTTIIEKKIGKVVLDGSEGWTKHSSRNIYYITDTNLNILEPIDNTYRIKALSNYLTPIPYYIDGTTKDIIGNENGIAIDVSTHRLYLGAKSVSSITDLTTWKTWLSNNNVEVYYILAEPYTIDLGTIDISLFENINHINLVDDIETETRVKYLINNVMNGTYATKGELELTNEQFQTTITNEFNSLERQMTSITQTGGAIDLAIQSSKDYTDSKNESLDNRITNSENNYNDLNNKYNTLNGKITDMNFSFKTDGLTIGTSGSEINSKLDNKGLKIYNANTLIAIFNQNGSGFKKLIATESIQLQNLLIQKRVINTPKANNMEVISFFFNKSLIENLTDLESD